MSSNEVIEVDPVRLGQAGLNALALAGAAIVAHYAAAPTDQLPDDVRDVLRRALAAFAEQPGHESGTQVPDADAAFAMVEHARVNAGRLPLTAVGPERSRESCPGVA